ncbi:MAG: hypothetical protein RBS96_07865 [Dehalococcoidales bacterium]|jgi:hypothetical protein|nr:hypothetical protein [Dehalococcoidales bacterium]
MNDAPNKTSLPLIAGILNIAIGFIILVMLVIFAIIPALLPINIGHVEAGVLAFLILPGLVIALLAIAGGIFAIQRKRWGWALAGSIAAAINPLPLGIVAIVLVVLSKNEFS